MMVGRSRACGAYRPTHHPAGRFVPGAVAVERLELSISREKKPGDAA